jgi:excisionase family DNA binding protein
VEQKEFYTVEEVAKLLELKEQTIRDYINRGQLSAYKFGKTWRIRRIDLDKFLESRRRKDE